MGCATSAGDGTYILFGFVLKNCYFVVVVVVIYYSPFFLLCSQCSSLPLAPLVFEIVSRAGLELYTLNSILPQCQLDSF